MMSGRCCLVLTLAVMALLTKVLAQDKELPDFLKVCKRHDPKLNECITKTVEELRPILRTGADGFLPSLEPLYIREIIVSKGSGLNIVGKDVKAFGSSEFVLSNLRADMDKLDFQFDLDFPMMYIEAEYDINGKVLLIPIKGNGPLRGNFTDIKAHVKLNGKLLEQGTNHFVNFTRLDIDMRVGHGKVKLENLFGGEKVLGDAVNAAINSNFNQFLNELRHPIEKALEEVLLEISNDCVRGYTLEQLSPL